MKENKLSFKWLWMCGLILVISLLIQALVGGVVGFVSALIGSFNAASKGITDAEVLTQMQLETVNNSMGFLLVLTHVIIILVFALWYRFGIRKKMNIAPINKVLTPKNIGVIILMAVSTCFFVNFGMEVAVLIIPQSILDSYMAMMENAGFGVSVLTTIAAICLAPIGEELVYRGTCLYYAEKFTEKMENRTAAFWIANAVQALGFGIFHFNLLQGSYAFLMGLALGYLAKRYKSVIPAMIAHLVINACSSFLWAYVYSIMPESTLAFGICALVCLGIVALSFKLGGKPLAEET